MCNTLVIGIYRDLEYQLLVTNLLQPVKPFLTLLRHLMHEKEILNHVHPCVRVLNLQRTASLSGKILVNGKELQQPSLSDCPFKRISCWSFSLAYPDFSLTALELGASVDIMDCGCTWMFGHPSSNIGHAVTNYPQYCVTKVSRFNLSAFSLPYCNIGESNPGPRLLHPLIIE